jgi:hypothetical protein
VAGSVPHLFKTLAVGVNLREPLHRNKRLLGPTPSSSCSHRRYQRRQNIPKWRLPGILGLGYHANDWTSCEFDFSTSCEIRPEDSFRREGRPQFGRSNVDIISLLLNKRYR